MTDASKDLFEPPQDCALCPRLAEYRAEQQELHPDWHNAPVPSFGADKAWLAVVGLAPGLTGANRTGRPFTGDHAGGLLYTILGRVGLASGSYDGDANDGVALDGVVVTNAVRCVPPQNKPSIDEIHNCGRFLAKELDSLPNLRVIIALGKIAHDAVLRVYDETLSHYAFGHGAEHDLPGGIRLIDSYHCSRYNQNTGRLTDAMFEAVFVRALDLRG